MTKYSNAKSYRKSEDVITWVFANLSVPSDTSISIQPTRDGLEIETIDIDMTLSSVDKAKLISQYTELAGKEV